MIKNYNQYLEQIKAKLDAMNKASGFNPQENAQTINQSNVMPSNDVFDMIGNGAKIWMEKQKNNNHD
jgi:predicted lipoprotein